MAKQNSDLGKLGRVDRILRFALAVWWLSPAFAPQFTADWLNIVIALVGWISLAESFLGWCWLHRLFGVDNESQ